MKLAGAAFQFDDVVVNREAFQVSKAGVPLTLEPKAIRVLVYLAENRQRAVGKGELLEAVWPETSVTDNALTRVIAQLRKALHDNSRQPRYIETVPTLGYRFIADVIDAQAAGPSVAPVAVPQRVSSRRLWLSLAAFVALAAASAAIWSGTQRPAAQIEKVVQFTTTQGLDTGLSFSPDGSAIVFASDRSGWFEIFVRPAAIGGHEIQLTNDGSQNVQPVWSPDGKSIAYTSIGNRGIYVVPALGGPPHRLTTFGSSPTWSPDSSAIAFRSEGVYAMSIGDQMPSSTSTIWIVPANGGTARPVEAARKLAARQSHPRFAPDGRLFFLVFNDLFSANLWWCRPESGEAAQLALRLPFIHDYQFTGDGDLLIAATAADSGGVISRIARNQKTPVPLLRTDQALPGSLAMSRDGRRLAYTSVRLTSNLWRLRLTAAGEAEGESEPITRDIDQRNCLPTLSPDGSHIAWYVRRLGLPGKIWVANSDGSAAVPLTPDTTRDSIPSWMPGGQALVLAKIAGGRTEWRSVALTDRSEKVLASVSRQAGAPRVAPDGKSAVFTDPEGPVVNVWKAAFDGSPPVQLTFDLEGASFPAWSPDGRWLVVQLARGDDTRLAVMPSSGGTPVEIVSTPGKNWSHSWAPDSDRIAYAGFHDGQWQLYWVSRTSGATRQITRFEDSNGFVRYPAWAPDGRSIVFERTANMGNIFLADLTP